MITDKITSNLTPLQKIGVGVIDLTGGGIGGVANVLVGQPLDTVKVKLQTFPHLYKHSWHCFWKTFTNEGIRGLYAGTVPAIIANVAENSVVFAAYGFCQTLIQNAISKKSIDELNPLENASAGFLAAFFSSLTLCPTELVKCRLQAMNEMALMHNQPVVKIGPWNLTKQVLKTEGIPGMYRGLSTTLFREMPGYFFFFGGYEASKQVYSNLGYSKDLGPVSTVICGGIGGICLWTSIYPFDVVKSRIQVENLRAPMFTVIKSIYAKEGLRAFYKGLGPTLLRTFPSSGALFLSYEYSKKALHALTGIPKE